MKNSFSLLFYIKKTKADSNGKTMIYMRITVNGRRAELSIKRKIDIKKWSSDAGRAKGHSEEAQKINQFIDIIYHNVYKIHQNFIENNISYTAIKIRDYYLGKNDNQKMTVKIFKDHNDQVEKLVGKDFAPGTAERYKTAKMHVENYIKKEFKLPRLDQVKDIFLFCCFTGLAYADVKKLTKDSIVIGIDGNKWINTKRTKTNTVSNIPLLPLSTTIIEKYASHKDVLDYTKSTTCIKQPENECLFKRNS